MYQCEKTDCKSIGARIKERREARGMTQEALAKLLFVSRESVNQWERGGRDLRTGQIIALSELLEVSCDYLLTGINTPNIDFCKQTGLSNRALENLIHSWSRSRDIDVFINGIFENELLKYAAYDYKEYISAKHKLEEFKKKGMTSEYDRDYWLGRGIALETIKSISFETGVVDTGEIHKCTIEDMELLLTENMEFCLFRYLETIKYIARGDKHVPQTRGAR